MNVKFQADLAHLVSPKVDFMATALLESDR